MDTEIVTKWNRHSTASMSSCPPFMVNAFFKAYRSRGIQVKQNIFLNLCETLSATPSWYTAGFTVQWAYYIPTCIITTNSEIMTANYQEHTNAPCITVMHNGHESRNTHTSNTYDHKTMKCSSRKLNIIHCVSQNI